MKKPFALIIEDTENLATIFSKALQKVEFETEIINDGKTAQTRLKEIVPNLVILDLHLPYVSGKELLQQIGSDPRLNNTRVILVTADALLAERLRNQVDLVLLKPISFKQLTEFAARFSPRTN